MYKYTKGCWENASNWIKWAFTRYSRPFDHEKDTEVFKGLLSIDSSHFNIDNELSSIKNDITRTVQNEEYFYTSNQGYNKVIEVLKGFTLYDSKWGYVQGMNFIVAALVYHSNSSIAFWLFTSLIEDYQLRLNYIQGFEGYYNKTLEIWELIEKNDNSMFEFLVWSFV